MSALPTGTVTFLFTDIEGSSRLWEQHPEVMQAALDRHDALLAACIEQHGGVVVKSRGEGDSFFAVFARAADAAAAACALQRALLAEPWPAETPLSVRLALHTGEAQFRGYDYFGAAVNRCARLRAAAHGGQVLLSLATHELVRDHLPEGVTLQDLGEHRLKDLARPEHIFQLRHPELPSDFPPLRSLDALPHNLPLQVTRFIGREREMAEVAQLLEKTRLLTVTGTGGTGKTRLALQVAADLLPEYRDGVWLVELAPLSDPALVPQTVAAVLGVREDPGKSLTGTLIEALKPRKLLLVLDNCEHLLEACAALADALLRSCPGAHLLATSREGLNIPGETPYRLRSLSAPGPRHLPATLQSLARYESVQLFIDRATIVAPSFAVTDQNAPVVARVCQRLDGIPLAIELAAARVKALPVEQLAARLDDRFRLLTGGSRTALPRHQTLRALIDWSYELLSEPERKLLQRLSVFAGGWTLEAAEVVGAGEGIEAWEVIDLLTSLVEKSVVVYEEGERGGRSEAEAVTGGRTVGARYRLLETVRQYARDRLLEAGETEVVRGQHLAFFLRLGEEAEPKLQGQEQAVWLERLEQEHDNLRAALDWSLESGEAELGLRLASALWPFCENRGYGVEGGQRLLQLLSLPGASGATAMRAKALACAGGFVFGQNDPAATRPLFEESLAICRKVGDKQGIARALTGLAIVAIYREGNAQAARALFEEVLAIGRELEDQHRIATSLRFLSDVAWAEQEYGAAAAFAEESLAISRQLGDRTGVAWSLDLLGQAARDQGDYGKAEAFLEEALAIRRELGSQPGMVWSLVALGDTALYQGEDVSACNRFENSLTLAREVQLKPGIVVCTYKLAFLALKRGDHTLVRSLLEEHLAIKRELGEPPIHALELRAQLYSAQGQPGRAARLFGAAERLRETGGLAPVLAERALYDESVAAVRAALGEGVFAAAWAEGRAMPLEQAIAYALEG